MLCVDLGGGKAKFRPKEWTVLDFRTFDIKWDFREEKPLPFEDKSVDFFYCGFLLPYLNSSQILFLLKEIRRTIKNDGCFRLNVPDVKIIVKWYMDKEQKLLSSSTITQTNQFTRNTFLGQLSAFFYTPPGKEGGVSLISAFDEEIVLKYLKEAGFSNIKMSSFGKYPNKIFEGKDTDRYSRYSLYVNVFGQ